MLSLFVAAAIVVALISLIVWARKEMKALPDGSRIVVEPEPTVRTPDVSNLTPPSPYVGQPVDSGVRDYFVSHASTDAAQAMILVKAMELAGLRCWIAPRNIKAGQSYGDAIGAAVARLTKATLVLVSQGTEDSAGVKSELELARRYNRPIVPVILNNHPPGKGMLYYIGTSHWLPFDDASPATIEALVDAVRD